VLQCFKNSPSLPAVCSFSKKKRGSRDGLLKITNQYNLGETNQKGAREKILKIRKRNVEGNKNKYTMGTVIQKRTQGLNISFAIEKENKQFKG
jgi:hypothetical protein